MMKKVFPRTVDNTYDGLEIAKWVLVLFIAKSFFAAGVHMFAPDGGAQSIASMALDQFTQGGADSVVTMFGMWGIEQLVIGLIGVVVLVRYRALIPMMALVYVVEYALRFAAPMFTPGVVTAHTPPGRMADFVLVPLSVVMFALSLITPRAKRRDAGAASAGVE